MFTRISAIAYNTFTELVRQKVFYILLIFSLVAIGSSVFMAELKAEEKFQMIKDVCLGTMAIFTSLLAILATANFLPKDSEDRTIYTLLSKPVPRFAYLLGKLSGMVILLFLFILLMSGVFCLVLWLQEHSALAKLQTELTGEELTLQIKSIKDATFNFNLVPGILIIFAKSVLLAAMTLFISTFATSSLFTVMISAAMYFIGHLQATAREYLMPGGIDTSIWTKLLTGIVAILFPDLQAFNLADDVIAGAAIPMAIFLKTVALGGLYVVIYFMLSAFVFSNREL
jgi:hypothetical protein